MAAFPCRLLAFRALKVSLGRGRTCSGVGIKEEVLVFPLSLSAAEVDGEQGLSVSAFADISMSDLAVWLTGLDGCAISQNLAAAYSTGRSVTAAGKLTWSKDSRIEGTNYSFFKSFQNIFWVKGTVKWLLC